MIVGVQATAARMSQETVAAQGMLTRFAQWQGREPESVAADTTYGNGEFLQWLADRNITPYMRTRDSIHRKRSPFYGPERFTYQPEHNRYICPAGQPLNYGGRVYGNRAYNYIGTRKRCGACAQRGQCTSAAFPFPDHPPERTSPAKGTRVGQHRRVREGTTAEKESGSTVCGTQESDWTASPAPEEIEVCTGAVLPGSGSPEHQATSAVPQPAGNTCSASYHLAEVREEKLGQGILAAHTRSVDVLFQRPRLITSVGREIYSVSRR